MADEVEKPKKSFGIMSIIKSAGFLAVLVVIEMVAAAMMIPSAEETEALAHELARSGQLDEFAEEEDTAPGAGDRTPTIEVELFTNNITRFDPETDSTLNVQFSIFGVVLESDQEDFGVVYAANQSRIHEQIMLTLHGAETADLAAAGLGLIKRQILEKTNRTIGRPLLREVVFTQLNFVER